LRQSNHIDQLFFARSSRIQNGMIIIEKGSS
jgi:hypothetical protein